jgi:hypothetical protein
LVENLDMLNELLEVPLVSAEPEQAAGAFSVDILAEDEDGKSVVIENQLERSNHDHLGKVITYLAFYGAASAVWIVSDPRPEHVAAVSWLNESTTASFYLLKVEAVRIGTSAPAPLLTKIVGPSAATREIASTKKARGERAEIRRRFWVGLLDYARTQTKLHAGRSGTDGPYLGSGSGLRGRHDHEPGPEGGDVGHHGGKRGTGGPEKAVAGAEAGRAVDAGRLAGEVVELAGRDPPGLGVAGTPRSMRRSPIGRGRTAADGSSLQFGDGWLRVPSHPTVSRLLRPHVARRAGDDDRTCRLLVPTGPGGPGGGFSDR